jgi:hypothetical protein
MVTYIYPHCCYIVHSENGYALLVDTLTGKERQHNSSMHLVMASEAKLWPRGPYPFLNRVYRSFWILWDTADQLKEHLEIMTSALTSI